MRTVAHSDGTAGISYGYDRLGRQTVLTNGAIVCSFAYNSANELLTETYAGGPLVGISATNANDSLLRRTAIALSSQPSTLVQFGYDAALRLSNVTNGNQTIAYGYLANSPFVQSLTFKQGGVTRLTTTKSYDNVNRMSSLSSVPSASPPISFTYSYNSANQRTAITNADNSRWAFQYDSFGQVTSGNKYWNDGTPVPGQQFAYGFDDIGNRTNSAGGGDQNGSNLRTAIYAANSLNQVTNRTVPGYINVLSSANSNATVTIWGANLLYARASQKGNYFRAEVSVTNTSAAVWLTLTNLAVLNNGSNADIVSTNIGNVYLAKTPEQFTFDADGNLTSDGRWTNTWNAENRLTSQTSLSDAAAGSKYKVDYTYDFAGRMIQRVVSTNSGAQYAAYITNRFVYDGPLQFAELDGTNGLAKGYVRGLDLGGTLTGAGGAGGLLLINAGSNGTHYYVTDGSGNVAALVSANDGTTSAQYAYGPFGELLRRSGAMAFVNTFAFSSQYTDYTTRRVLYLLRSYDPSKGTWDSRDPIEEQGGVNLYGFVLNSPVYYLDSNGKYTLRESLQITGDFFVGAGQGLANVGDAAWGLIKSPYTATKGLSQAGGTLSTPYGRDQFARWLTVTRFLADKYAKDECFRQLMNAKLGYAAKDYFTDPYRLSRLFANVAVIAGSAGFGAWADTAEGAAQLSKFADLLVAVLPELNAQKAILFPDELLQELARLEKLWPDRIRALEESGDVLAMADANKLHHVFDNPQHNLGALLANFGGDQNLAFQAIETATQSAISSQGLTGIFQISVTVGTETVTVRGAVINGVAKIGTVFK